jgi:pimeloyl-ACP methyl ester carboxylesterase
MSRKGFYLPSLIVSLIRAIRLTCSPHIGKGLSALLIICGGYAFANNEPLRTETVRIDSAVPEFKLALHHEFAAQSDNTRKRIVLFAEGSAVPTAGNAAFKIGGLSWMDDLAEHGFDVWSLDYLGTGDSSRYPESKTGGPPGRASDCAEQLAEAARYILKKEKVEKLTVIGDSFGSLVAGIFATRTPELLDKLVLVAPVTPAAQPKPMQASQVPNYDFVTVDDFWRIYMSWLPKGESTGVNQDFFLRDWGPKYLDGDPESRHRNPPSVMVPSGPDIDLAEVSAGRFVYEPAKIKVPILVILGEWDAIATEEGGKRLFDLLTGTQRKSLVIIGRGTHLPQFESVRFELYRNIRTFLEIDDPDMVDSARY